MVELVKKIGRYLRNNKFSTNTFILMGGTVISQAIPFLISPILTRLYSPEEFGLFGLYFSIIMIFSVFITGRYEMAVILPEKDEDAINVVGLSILITIVVSLFSLILIGLFHNQFTYWLNNEKIKNLLYIIPVSMCFIGLYQSFNYWSNRKEQYKRLAISRVARSVNTSALSVFLGFSSKSGGLVVGDTVGQGIATGFLCWRVWKKDKGLLKIISKEGIIFQAKRYKQFPKFNVLSGLLEKSSGQMPVLLLSSFFGASVVGFFSFSQRVISAPGAIIAKAIGDVFRQKANVEYLKSGNCEKSFLTTFKKLLLIAIIPFTFFGIFAPEIFSFIFSSEWKIAGEYAQIMTIMFFLQFVVSPLSNMFLVAEKQHIDLYIQIFLFIAILGSMMAGHNIFNQPKACILFFTISYSLKYCIELYLSFQFSKGTGNKQLILKV
jgi:O-antigen/teichoic acid export membrane protein